MNCKSSKFLVSTTLLVVTASIGRSQATLWTLQHGTQDHDTAHAIAEDGTGGVFVGGSTSGTLGASTAGSTDGWISRRTATGQLQWIKQLGTSVVDTVTSAASDGTGGVFVAGDTDASLFGASYGLGDAWLARFDALGTLMWGIQFGSGGYDAAWGAATDGVGGVFICGTTTGDLGGPLAGIGDAWIAHYDGSGQQSWLVQFGTPASDGAYRLSPDGVGGAFVAGHTQGSLASPNAGNQDGWIAHYNVAGTQLWAAQIGTSGYDLVTACTLDGVGGAVFGGVTSGAFSGTSHGGQDAWLARMDGSGQATWIHQFGSGGDDRVYAATLDGTGGTFVAGYTDSDFAGPPAGSGDVWLVRFDTFGSTLWTKQFGTTEEDYVTAITGDGAGSFHVAGYTSGDLGGPSTGGQDIWVAAYDGNCGTKYIYCTPSSTSIVGCTPSIGAVGSPSISAPNNFQISTATVPGGNLGLCFFNSTGTASTPFGTLGGMICMQGPIYRSAPKPSGGSSGSCNGSYTFRLTDLIAASSVVASGATLHAQVWARDPANVDGFLLSNGIEFTVCP